MLRDSGNSLFVLLWLCLLVPENTMSHEQNQTRRASGKGTRWVWTGKQTLCPFHSEICRGTATHNQESTRLQSVTQHSSGRFGPYCSAGSLSDWQKQSSSLLLEVLHFPQTTHASDSADAGRGSAEFSLSAWCIQSDKQPKWRQDLKQPMRNTRQCRRRSGYLCFHLAHTAQSIQPQTTLKLYIKTTLKQVICKLRCFLV